MKIEVGLQNELVRRYHLFDNFFEVKKLNLLIKGKMVEKSAFVAKNASQVVMHVFHIKN